MPDAPSDTTAQQSQGLPTAGNAEHAKKHPEEWVTGDEPMTEAQASLLSRLCKEAGEPFEPSLSKAQAAQRLDELQAATGTAEGPTILMGDQTDG